MQARSLKDALYEQVARVGKALSSPKRLEVLELLSQGEKTVEQLAEQARADVRLISAHLRTLREARLVQSRREGTFMHYRLSGRDVGHLLVHVRDVATEHLVELRLALDQMTAHPATLTGVRREQLLDRARSGDVVVIDVRPLREYETARLPFARSMPIEELERRISELPKDKEIVAYCRGPFCLLSNEAVALLRSRGYHARKITDGVAEWQSAGLPIEAESEGTGEKA